MSRELFERIDQRLERGHVARPAVAQHDRLDQGRPVEIVDVVERRPASDQRADDIDMTEMLGALGEPGSLSLEMWTDRDQMIIDTRGVGAAAVEQVDGVFHGIALNVIPLRGTKC